MTTLPPAWQAAEALEVALGDPRSPDAAFSFTRSLADDEGERYPQSGVEALQRAGYARHLVPAEHGGAFVSFEESLALQRLASRRDLTAAIALGQTFLGSLPVWLRGSATQRAHFAKRILAGSQAALALTEEDHGGDLLACELRAEKQADSYRLHGRKWLINNATLGRDLCVFARTGSEGGLGGFSLVHVDKALLAPGSFTQVEKLRTHGIRGADISGIAFHHAPLPAESIVGTEGGGLELALQTLQITRVGCTSFSLGAGDTALRTTLAFARNRRLFEATVLDLPHAAATLVEAFVDLLACDVVSSAAARAVHASPEQLGLWSAVAKTFVPGTVSRMIEGLASVLGARHYVRAGEFAVFQKLMRDHAVVPLFDGSTAVNLDAISQQLARVLRPRSEAADVDATLATIFDPFASLPPLSGSDRPVLSGGRDDVTQRLPKREALVAAAPGSIAGRLNSGLIRLEGELARLRAETDALLDEGRAAMRRTAAAFALAERFARLWAACACVHAWHRSRERRDGFFADGAWLVAVLDRFVGEVPAPLNPGILQQIRDRLLTLDGDERLFAITPIRLGR